jgi:integrase
MDAVKPFQVQKILNTMHEKYAPSTIRQELVLMKRLFNWSREQGLYQGVNPCDQIKPPKFDNKVTNPLDRKGLHRLMVVLDEWPNERATMVVKFALYSGKRKGEILGLQWGDVDLDGGLMTLKNTKNGSVQSLPVNKSCLEILKRCNEIRSPNSPYIFLSRRGLPYNGGGFDKTWRRIRKKAGITIRFHDLRHTFASYLASSGKVDIYTLKELLGHSTLEMTQRYAHLINGALRKAVEVADEVF